MAPGRVFDVCKHVMLGGDKLVFDKAKSHGSVLHDALHDRDYVDCFSFFASQALGHNHPGLDEPEFERRLLAAAKYKPANPDMYTEDLARGIETFCSILPVGYRTNVFFIDGGSAAVENAFKACMDAKVRDNLDAGRGELGSRIMHLRHAFHGRGGYTLSVTNTDPNKTMYFAKFDWPRVSSPARAFPETAEGTAALQLAEEQCLREVREAIAKDGHDIAAMIIEPIQCEGGDRHFRPPFLRILRKLCADSGVYFICDEVQCGMGITGSWWVSESFGLAPDIMVFGKKAQVCGLAARDDFRSRKPSVFTIPSRINSTWGGNLTDYVRVAQIIDIIQKHRYLDNVRTQGTKLQAALLALHHRYPNFVFNPRGEGLLCAFDVRDKDTRNQVLSQLRHFGEAEKKPGVYLIPRGEASVGFRPYLDVDAATIDYVLAAIESVVGGLAAKTA